MRLLFDPVRWQVNKRGNVSLQNARLDGAVETRSQDPVRMMNECGRVTRTEHVAIETLNNRCGQCCCLATTETRYKVDTGHVLVMCRRTRGPKGFGVEQPLL